MMPISLKQLDYTTRRSLAEASRPRFESVDPDEVKQAAVTATRLSMNQNLLAHSLWAELIGSCKRAQISVESCVFDQVLFGRSLAERVIESGDWKSCIAIARALNDGAYAHGQIIKKGAYFMTAPDEEGRSRGVRIYHNGGYYGGEFVNYLRDGLGVWDSAHMWTYSGEWSQDKMEGQGCSHTYLPKIQKDVGYFSNGRLVKPAKSKNIWTSLQRLIK